ncbi:MAG: hypothetical protein J0G35_20175 [Acidobacteriales bacterium]|nr:hypothetical protein [Terriglobales bacterium]
MLFDEIGIILSQLQTFFGGHCPAFLPYPELPIHWSACSPLPQTSQPFRNISELAFNALDIAAVMVLIGAFSALWRCGRDNGAIAVQQFADHIMPLIMLFSISENSSIFA